MPSINKDLFRYHWLIEEFHLLAMSFILYASTQNSEITQSAGKDNIL